MPLRVGFFSHDFHPPKGGQGRNFSELFQRLYAESGKDESYEFFAFSPCANSLPNHVRLFGFIEKLPLFAAQTLFWVFLNFTLKKLIKRHQLDLIILNGGPGGIFLFKKPDVPLAYCANHTYSQQIRFILDQQWKGIFFDWERRSYSFADYLLPISSTTKTELLEVYDIPEEKIRVIPVGIDTSKFCPAEIEKVPNSLFFLGRLQSRKGIEFLIDTLPLIKEKLPGIMLFIGGKGELRSRLEERVEVLELHSNVQFLGEVSEMDLVSWYNRTQILIVPSIFEGLGISVLEGMACGTPVIGTFVPGISDTIEHGRSGILVPFGDRKALAKEVIQLLSDEDQYRTLREGGLQRVREAFSWEKVIQLYLNFLREIK